LIQISDEYAIKHFSPDFIKKVRAEVADAQKRVDSLLVVMRPKYRTYCKFCGGMDLMFTNGLIICTRCEL